MNEWMNDLLKFSARLNHWIFFCLHCLIMIIAIPFTAVFWFWWSWWNFFFVCLFVCFENSCVCDVSNQKRCSFISVEKKKKKKKNLIYLKKIQFKILPWKWKRVNIKHCFLFCLFVCFGWIFFLIAEISFFSI